jgi:hypothetical protein
LPFVKPDNNDWVRTMSRVLVSGDVNSGKTTSVRTCHRPVHVISLPGEGGTNSIPREDGIVPYVWTEDADSRASSKVVIDQVRALTVEILTGKRGECRTIFVDGLHRLYDHFLNQVTGGAYLAGREFEALLYSRSHVQFVDYLKLVKDSSVSSAFFTVWSAKDPDKPELRSQSPQHVYPDLPGRLARRVMGEFSLVIASHSMPSVVANQPPRFYWQLKANNVVHGAMIKIAPEIAAHLPSEMEQDWQKLEKLLMEAGEKVKQGVKPVTKQVIKK